MYFSYDNYSIIRLNDLVQSTHDVLKNSSTYIILNKWWDTSIALSTFASSFLLVIFICITMFLLKNHYKNINDKNPFVRPAITILCTLVALVIGWIIEMFGRNDSSMQITYFSISISPVMGRWIFECIIHQDFSLSRGLIYICSMHTLGTIIGFIVSRFIVKTISKNYPKLGYTIHSTFLYKPLKTKTHLFKSIVTWFFAGAIVPFCGYFVYLKSNSGTNYFTPFSATMCSLVVIFILMFFTHELGYYDGNLILAVVIQLLNIYPLKNKDSNQIKKNIPISVAFAVGSPILWGSLYGLIFNLNN